MGDRPVEGHDDAVEGDVEDQEEEDRRRVRSSIKELRSLVVHTLETNGVLGQIRAQLRANVYKAIDCEDEKGGAGNGSVRLATSRSGRLMAEIVAEFFEFYEFRHSLSVFVPESNLGRERRSRTEVALDAGLMRVLSDTSILEQLVGLARGSDLGKGGEFSSASSTTASSTPPPNTGTPSVTRPWATDKPDCDTPPPGCQSPTMSTMSNALPAVQGDRLRVNSASSPVVASASGGKSGGDSPRGGPNGSIDVEACKSSDDLLGSEEVSRGSLRKPKGKLPSLSGSGKDFLPQLKISGAHRDASGSMGSLSGSGAGAGNASGSMSGSVAIGGNSPTSASVVDEDMVRFQKMDRPIARLGVTRAGSIAAGTGNAGGHALDNASSPPLEAQSVSEEHGSALERQVSQEEQLSGIQSQGSGDLQARSLPRSASPSPATSAVESPARSPMLSSKGSPAGSPAASPLASPAASPVASPAPSSAASSASRSLGPAEAAVSIQSGSLEIGSGQKAADGSRPEDVLQDECLSLDESDGSGSIDLAGDHDDRDTDVGKSSVLRGTPAPNTSAGDTAGQDEVDSDNIEEDFHVEAFAESEEDGDNDW